MSIVDFFDLKLAKNKFKEKIQLIIGNNVIAHVKNLNSFVKGLHKLANENTIISIEIPHILNLFKKKQFDTIYHEHHYYYSLKTLIRIFEKFKLKIIDVELIKTHGGSLRIFAKKNRKNLKINKSVSKILNLENKVGLDSYVTHKKFNLDVFKIKMNSIKLIKKINKDKKLLMHMVLLLKEIHF